MFRLMVNFQIATIFLTLISLLGCHSSQSENSKSSQATVTVGSNPEPGKPGSPPAPSTPTKPEEPAAPAENQDLVSLQKSCVVSVCGNEEAFVNPHLKDSQLNFTNYIQVSSNLKKPVQKLMGQIIHRNMLLDRGYLEIFKDISTSTEKISLSEGAKTLYLSYQLLRKFPDYLSTFEWTSEKGYTLNEDKMKAITPGISSEEILAFQKLVGPFLFVYRMQMTNDLTYFRQLYPSASDPEIALFAEASEIEKMMEDLKAKIPEFNYFYSDVVFQRVKDKKAISRSERKHFRSISEKLRILKSLADPEILAAVGKVKFDFMQAISATKIAYLSGARRKLFENKALIKTTLKEATDSCVGNMNYAYGALPSKSQLNEFRKGAQEIIDRGLSMAALRGENSEALALKKSKLMLQLPQSREEALEDWAETFSIEKASEKAGLSYIQSMGLKADMVLDEKDLNFEGNTKSKLLLSLLFQETNAEFFEDVVSICKKAIPGFLIDHSIPWENYIELSWPTIVYPALGYSIFAHEFGHHLSMGINNFASSAKSCLKEFQGTDKYLEEDFADLFATEIGAEMGFKVGNTELTNMACGLIENQNGNWNVRDGLKNLHPGDPHSSGFFRLIAINSMSQKMTNQCQKALDFEGEKRFNNYCKW